MVEATNVPAQVAEGVGSGKGKKRRLSSAVNAAADLTPEEARAKAAEEGLTLIEANTQTGFLYVYLWNSGGGSKAKEGGEAASASSTTAVAATHEQQQEPPTTTTQEQPPLATQEPAPQQLQEAQPQPPQPQQASAASTAKAPRVFQLQPQKGVSMGYYRSAEGAALAYARHIGAEAAAAKAAKVKSQPRAQAMASSLLAELGNLSTEDALRLAQAEGLTLVRSARSKSGYKHVATMKLQARPFRLNAQNGITSVEGNFASAAAAALAHARQIGPEASAAEASAEQVRGEALELAPGGGFGTKVKLVPTLTTPGGAARAASRPPPAALGAPPQLDAAGSQIVATEVINGVDEGGASASFNASSGSDGATAASGAAGGPSASAGGAGVTTVPIGDVQMLTGEAALRLAAEEGLTDKVDSLRSSTNKSGFKNVTHHCDTEKHKTSKKSRPFQLTRHIEKSRRAASLGYFASAEAAALVQARILRVEESASTQPPTHEPSQLAPHEQLTQEEAPPPAAPAPPALPVPPAQPPPS